MRLGNIDDRIHSKTDTVHDLTRESADLEVGQLPQQSYSWIFRSNIWGLKTKVKDLQEKIVVATMKKDLKEVYRLQ